MTLTEKIGLSSFIISCFAIQDTLLSDNNPIVIVSYLIIMLAGLVLFYFGNALTDKDE